MRTVFINRPPDGGGGWDQVLLRILFDFSAEQFQPVANQLKPHIVGNLFLECLEFGMLEFMNFACIDIDEMLVMLTGELIAGLTITNIELFHHTSLSSTPTVR